MYTLYEYIAFNYYTEKFNLKFVFLLTVWFAKDWSLDLPNFLTAQNTDMKGVTEKLLVSVAVWEEWDPDIWRPAFPDLWRTAPPTQRPVFLQDFDHSLNGATPQALHSQKTKTSSPPGLRPQFLQDFDPSLNRTTSLVPTGLQPQFQQDYDLSPNRTTPPVSTGLRPRSQQDYDPCLYTGLRPQSQQFKN